MMAAQALCEADIPQVYRSLQEAQSRETRVRDPAEKNLRAWERTSGFCSVLVSVLAQRDAEPPARLLAAICLKNVIRRQWVSSRRKVNDAGSVNDAGGSCFVSWWTRRAQRDAYAHFPGCMICVLRVSVRPTASTMIVLPSRTLLVRFDVIGLPALLGKWSFALQPYREGHCASCRAGTRERSPPVGGAPTVRAHIQACSP